MGNNIMCTINCDYRIAATIRLLETWFCFGYIILNALHIGNGNSNNNNNKSVIPVIIGATGTISKSFRKYVSDIPGNHDVKELQKTVILGTAHIFRKVLT